MEQKGSLILKIWDYFSIILVGFVTFLIVVIMYAKANNADVATITFIGDPMTHYFYKAVFIAIITNSVLIPVLIAVRIVLLRMFKGLNGEYQEEIHEEQYVHEEEQEYQE